MVRSWHRIWMCLAVLTLLAAACRTSGTGGGESSSLVRRAHVVCVKVQPKVAAGMKLTGFSYTTAGQIRRLFRAIGTTDPSWDGVAATEFVASCTYAGTNAASGGPSLNSCNAQSEMSSKSVFADERGRVAVDPALDTPAC